MGERGGEGEWERGEGRGERGGEGGEERVSGMNSTRALETKMHVPTIHPPCLYVYMYTCALLDCDGQFDWTVEHSLRTD